MFAETITINGIEYTYDTTNNTAELTDGKSLSSAVTIPESITVNGITYPVTSIGYKAFDGCSNMTSVAIPNSVTSIGWCAFWDCSGLTSVTIPNSVNYIGWGAFSGCNRLTSVAIGNSVTSIDSSAFNDCSSLTSVTIPNSVTSIGDCSFYNCNSLTSVTIGNSVTSIGGSAFCNCSSLKEVHVSDIVAWYNISFYDSYSNPLCYATKLYLDDKLVSDLVIPNGVKKINEYAFYGCSSLTSVTIGNSVTSIGDSAFKDCSSLTSVRFLGSVPPTGGAFNSYAMIYVPSEALDAYRTKFSKEHVVAFETQKTLDIILSQTGKLVDNIINLSADDMLQVTSVKVSGDMNGSDFLALNKLTNIVNLDISDANIVAGGGNYYQEYQTKNDAFKKFQLYALTALQTLKLPNTLQSIEDEAFRDDSSLISVTIPNSVTSIGNYAFYNCSGLSALTIPQSVTSISTRAFYNCRNLASVTIGNSVSYMGYEVFYNCSGLTSVTIGNAVTFIGTSAFCGCSNLEEVHISDIASWCNIYFDSTDANPLCYAHDLYLGDELVTNLEIPNGVKEIKKYAFYCCNNLTSVVFPNSVTSIGKYAFHYCNSIASVYSHNTIPPSPNSDSFSDYDATLYVPIGSKTDYWLHPIWGKFNKIEEFDPAGVEDIEAGDALLPTEYYNLNGVKVATVAPGEQPAGLVSGIYITRCGNKTAKAIIR